MEGLDVSFDFERRLVGLQEKMEEFDLDLLFLVIARIFST